MSMGPNSTKTATKAELARQTEEFLSRGGQVELVPSNVMRKEGKYGSWKEQDERGDGFTHGDAESLDKRAQRQRAAAKGHESRRADRRVKHGA